MQEKEKLKEFYRYKDSNASTMRLFGISYDANEPELVVYKVVHATEESYGIQEKNWHDLIWITKNQKNVNRPKYRETKEEALHDYICRKRKQVKILENKVGLAEARLKVSENMQGKRYCEFIGDDESTFDGEKKGKCEHIGTSGRCVVFRKELKTEDGWRLCCDDCDKPFYMKGKTDE